MPEAGVDPTVPGPANTLPVTVCYHKNTIASSAIECGTNNFCFFTVLDPHGNTIV